jgi:hypothetical protein
MDKEKVIKGLEKMLSNYERLDEVAINKGNQMLLLHRAIATEALALLKEQESIIESLKSDLHETLEVVSGRLNVVRCKDCIHYHYYGLSAETVSECTIDHCENPNADWFCADGERK